MKRTKPPARKAALNRRPIKTHRPKAQTGKPEAMRRFRETVCGAADSPLEAHHCLKASWLKRYADRNRLTGSAYWAVVLDPRIAIPLTARVHEQHTSRVAVIPGEALPERVLEAAREYGPQALAALEREHPGAVVDCLTCRDTGEVHDNPSRINDPQCERSWPCPDCEDGA